jgi:hypothetical protein
LGWNAFWNHFRCHTAPQLPTTTQDHGHKIVVKGFQNIFYPSVCYIYIQEVYNTLETIFSFPQQEEDYTRASICIWPGLELGECRQESIPPAKFVNIFISHLLTSKKHQASVSHVKFKNYVLRYKMNSVPPREQTC